MAGLTITPVVVILLAVWLYSEFYIFATLRENPNATLTLETLERLTLWGFVMVGAGALIGLVVSFLLIRLIVRQLSALVNTMQRVKDGDLTARSHVWAQDEIGEVQAAFNRMVEQLQQSRQTLLEKQIQMESLDTEKSAILVELNDKSQQLADLFRGLINVQEEERHRIARELHDETGQALTAILLRLKTLQDETDLETIQDRLNGLRFLTAQTLEEVRRISMDLRPTALDDLGLIPAIHWYIQNCCERSGLDISFISEKMNAAHRLPPEMEIVLYRAVQESITNVIRHAQATQVLVTLEEGIRSIWLTVADNGVGLPANPNEKGLGLAGLRERAFLAGGHFQIDSQDGEGTRLLIQLPLNRIRHE